MTTDAAPSPLVPEPTASRDPWALLRATIIVACVGAAFALVDLRDLHRPAVSDAAAPALLLVAMVAAWWGSGAARGSNATKAVWWLLWLLPVGLGLVVGPSPQAVFLTFPYWCLVAGAVTLGWLLNGRRESSILAAIVAMVGLFRVLLFAVNSGSVRELPLWIAVLLCYIVIRLFVRPSGTENEAFDSRRFIAFVFGMSILMGMLVPVSYTMLASGPEHNEPAWNAQQLLSAHPFGWGMGAHREAVAQFVDARIPARPLRVGSWQVTRFVSDLGMHSLPAILLLLAISIGVMQFDGGLKRQPSRNFIQSYLLTCMLVLAWFRLPVCWTNGMTLLLALLTASLVSPKPATAGQSHPLGHLTSKSLAVAALLLAIVQPVLLATTAASIQRGAPIPAWAMALPWTPPIREQCIRLREGTGVPGAADPAPQLKALAERWTRLAPHDEYAWIERVRAVYIADGPQATVDIARMATRRLPASAILARWYVRVLEESGHRDQAIAYVDALRARLGSLNPTLLQWREQAVAVGEANSEEPGVPTP